ncbi:probable gluconokinase isoform X3 [Colius striatus]|nr:probable gluconokinase isoform X3 [Colius striatus]XP_061873407.1 probable gluconokinase isoform X3 [Colius striatus]XP_061873408.1 probable gluconokinase isoform X3 [Colius striatus]XP_061873409.1 probable gluconokinase isoform X3 [Colius striatus]XP_061873410.1 probable gluconokinase isoform X3 [Colius striatus]
MAEGTPLSDEDRIPWLCALHDILRREDLSRQDAVLACSALKKMYRHVLAIGASAIESNQPGQPGENPALKILFVHLDGPIDIIAGRLEKRRGHFMPRELLKSQFDTLEPPTAPENFITVSIEKSLSEIVLEIESTVFQGCPQKGRDPSPCQLCSQWKGLFYHAGTKPRRELEKVHPLQNWPSCCHILKGTVTVFDSKVCTFSLLYVSLHYFGSQVSWFCSSYFL